MADIAGSGYSTTTLLQNSPLKHHHAQYAMFPGGWFHAVWLLQEAVRKAVGSSNGKQSGHHSPHTVQAISHNNSLKLSVHRSNKLNVDVKFPKKNIYILVCKLEKELDLVSPMRESSLSEENVIQFFNNHWVNPKVSNQSSFRSAKNYWLNSKINQLLFMNLIMNMIKFCQGVPDCI